MIFGAARVAPEKAVFRPALPMSFLSGTSEMQMNKMTYREQLLHPNWQRKRLEILQRDGFACQLCCEDQSTLHVHHKQYAKGRMAWEYPADELVTLCEECHETMHAQNDLLRSVTAKLPVDGPASIVEGTAVLAGWAHGNQGLDFDHVFQENPHSFAVGEVSQELGGKMHMDGLWELRAALKAAPHWVVQAECAAFAKTLLEKANTPPPASYLEAHDL